MGKGMKAGKKPKVRNGGGAKDMQKQLKQLKRQEQKKSESFLTGLLILLTMLLKAFCCRFLRLLQVIL